MHFPAFRAFSMASGLSLLPIMPPAAASLSCEEFCFSWDFTPWGLFYLGSLVHLAKTEEKHGGELAGYVLA
jgi:hypothetical protein